MRSKAILFFLLLSGLMQNFIFMIPRVHAVTYFSEDFEAFPAGWTTNTVGVGTITKDNTHVNGGSWAVKIYDPNDASRAYAYKSMTVANGDYHIQVYTYPTVTVTYDRPIILVQTYDIAPASASVILALDDVAGTIYLSSYQVAAGWTTIKALAAGQYYKIDCFVDVSATEMTVYVDDVQEATVPIYAGDAANPDQVYMGSTGNLANGVYWADDLVIDDDMTPPVLIPGIPTKFFGAGFNGSIAYVDLRWTSNLTDISFFEVQNSTDEISWDHLGISTTNNYTDLEVVNGTQRYYRIRACNFTGGAWGNSTWTDINFETVYFEAGGGGLFPGLAIGIALLIIGAILALEKRR